MNQLFYPAPSDELIASPLVPSQPEPCVRFNQDNIRSRGKDKIPARLLEELKNGPVNTTQGRVVGLLKYRKEMEKAGTPVPAVKSYRLAKGKPEVCLALADGPFERFVQQPDWI
jgi:hypothetical protein